MKQFIKKQSRIIITGLIVLLALLLINSKLYTQQQNTSTQNSSISTQSNTSAENDMNEELYQKKGASLFEIVKQGGLLMIVLILFAVISLAIIIERLIFFTRKKIWDIKNVDKFLKKAAENSKANYREDMEDNLRNEYMLYSNRLEKGMSLLSGLGQLAPIVGFLGTVLGMINAFASIALATTVNAKVVAVGIQIALVTTAGGLIVAAPTLTAFYFFQHMLQNRYTRSEEIIDQLCKGMPKLSEKV